MLQQLIGGYRGLPFGARLALFARGAWLPLGLLFFCCYSDRSFVDWCSQFALALLAGLAVLAWGSLAARLAFGNFGLFTGFAFLAWWARLALFAGLTLLASLALLTGLAFFARLALLITATARIAATVLLASAAALVIALWARRGGLLLDFGCGLRFFRLACEQSDQGFDQALEQTWFLHRRGNGCFGWRCGGCRRCGALRCGLDRRFLANQGACGADRLSFFGLGRAHFVAGLACHDFWAVVTQSLNFEVRRFQVIVRQDEDARTGAQLDLGDRVAFLVEQECCNLERHAGANLGGAVLEGFFFDQAQNRQRQRFDVTNDALAVAAWADDAAGLAQRGAQTLAGHFQQTEARNAADLDTCTVGFQCFAHLLLDGALVLGRGHVDEVDDD